MQGLLCMSDDTGNHCLFLSLSMRNVYIFFFSLAFLVVLPRESIAQLGIDGYHVVDFGAPASDIPINSITQTRIGTRQAIPSIAGCDDGLEIVIVDDFAGVNNSGTQQPDTSLHLPASLTGDSFFGHTGMFNGGTNPTAAIEISGFFDQDTAKFTLFASRMGAGNRQTCYTFFGQDTIEVCLDPNNNIDQIVEVTTGPIEIDANGQGLVRIEMTAGPENDTPEGFFYLGGISIEYEVSWTTESSHSIFIGCPSGTATFEVGEQVDLSGGAFGPCNPALVLDVDGALVDTIFSPYFNFGYTWTVPNFPTTNARLRLAGFGAQGQFASYASTGVFSIVEPSDPCTIVVLGSSTAAGTGPSTPDSTWVNRFRKSYSGCDSRVEVVNLARGGYNTFKLLPDDGFIPTGVNQTIDSSRNITAAMALNPQAIIINLPSNDAALGYDVAQQLANYDQILAAAGNVPVYVSTPQPRNFGPAQVAIQRELLDSTIARFGARAIDFWTPFATNDGLLDSLFDSGDGVHMNDAAHRILWDSVLAKQIDTLLTCQRLTNSVFTPNTIPQLSLKLSPNPTGNNTRLEFELPQSARVAVSLYNLEGKLVRQLPLVQGVAGDNTMSIERDSLPAGTYLVRLEAESRNGGRRVGASKLVVK